MKIDRRFLSFVILIILGLCGCRVSTNTKTFDDLTIPQKYTALEDAENWYYFSDSIYKINKKSGVQTLVDRVESIGANCLDNGWIYFVDPDWNVCRVQTSGRDHTVLFNAKQFQEYEDDEYPVRDLKVVGHKVLLRMIYTLYCFDMETETITQISDEVFSFETKGQNVYYVGLDMTIFTTDLQTGESSVVLQSQYSAHPDDSTNLYKNFIFIGDTMYYYMRNPDGLYCYQDGESRLISDDSDINEFSLLGYDGELYFVIRGDSVDQLMRYDPKDKTLDEVLQCNNVVSNPKIMNGYFYYRNSSYEIQEMKIS